MAGGADELAALRAEVAALTARVAQLERTVAATPAAGGPSPDEDVWRRLGLTEGERRTVTVLFADVSGFTALSETLDPEAVQLVMRDTMALLAECVVAEGGTVEKFIGDAVCAIFGAPVAHVDEPERAARAALAMHAALAARAAARPELPPLSVHAGINTGPVIAGAVGDGSQFGVMGDTINTAARLMDLAEHGQTFVSAATARRLRRRFRVEDAGVHTVKGKADPLSVASLVGVLSDDERAQRQRLRAPLIGRDAERAAIGDLAARAADGAGALVLLVGEPGTGVSRIAADAAEALEADGWQVLRASARVHSETPLGLVASAVAPLVGDDPELAATLRGGVAAPHDFELELGAAVARAAAARPLLVVLDDVDDADAGSLEVVRYLARATAGDRVLWVLTGERVPASLAEADAVVLRVGPLADADVEALLAALLPGALSGAQRERLANLAEGNPQFAVEIAHALVDDGVVDEVAPGEWRLVGDADHVAIPNSVAELIEARIDRLPTHARITLQDASVIGQRFSAALLGRVATIPSALDVALAELVEAELVVAPDDPAALWSFRSRLVREVAYESVLRRRRPAAHRAVADALLALEPDRVAANADLLAHHLEESDDPVAAFPHLVEAAERAEVAYNFTGALERAERALRLRDRFPNRVDDAALAALLQRVGTVKLVLGDESGLIELQEAAEVLGRVGSPAALVSLQERVAWYLTIAGRPDRAAPYLDAAAGHPAATVTRALQQAAAGDLTGGLAAVSSVLSAPGADDDAFTAARALLVAGVCHLGLGEGDAAIERFQACLERSWANVFGTLADRCGRWLIAALVDAGRDDEALELAEPLLARSDDRGDPSVGCGVRAALARLWRRRGDGDRAAALAADAVALAEGRRGGSDAAPSPPPGAGRRVAPDAAAEAYLISARLRLDAGDAPGAAAALAAIDALAGESSWLLWWWGPQVSALRAEAGSTVPEP